MNEGWCVGCDAPAGTACKPDCPRLQKIGASGSVLVGDIIPFKGRYKKPIEPVTPSEAIRKFDTGATRDVDTGKFAYEGFLSYPVLVRFGAYMHKNRFQKDGTLRDSDNWQKGIPQNAYMDSMFRHFMSVWGNHRGYETGENMEEALCALLFNAQGYLHELLKAKNMETFDDPAPNVVEKERAA